MAIKEVSHTGKDLKGDITNQGKPACPGRQGSSGTRYGTLSPAFTSTTSNGPRSACPFVRSRARRVSTCGLTETTLCGTTWTTWLVARISDRMRVSSQLANCGCYEGWRRMKKESRYAQAFLVS